MVLDKAMWSFFYDDGALYFFGSMYVMTSLQCIRIYTLVPKVTFSSCVCLMLFDLENQPHFTKSYNQLISKLLDDKSNLIKIYLNFL